MILGGFMVLLKFCVLLGEAMGYYYSLKFAWIRHLPCNMMKFDCKDETDIILSKNSFWS